MSICCGQMRTTPFCPQCGKLVSLSHGASLLAHLRKQERSQQKRLDTLKGRRPTDGSRKDWLIAPTEKAVAKFSDWCDWVAKRISPSAEAREIDFVPDPARTTCKTMTPPFHAGDAVCVTIRDTPDEGGDGDDQPTEFSLHMTRADWGRLKASIDDVMAVVEDGE